MPIPILATAIRLIWIAIEYPYLRRHQINLSLGRFFTGTIVIKDDHRLIKTGLYKYLRHPAYAGALLAHLGLGLSFSNWFSLGLSSIPFFVAAFYRMRIEDQTLQEIFGAKYVEYSSSTKRLIPKIY